jgi:hypothetical protein
LGYADYLGALQRYRLEYPRDPSLLTVSHFLINYPFATRLYPDSLDAVEHVKQWGTATILSDGDVVFLPFYFQDFLLGCSLALFRKLLLAFFGMNENVVRIAEMFFPFFAGCAVTSPIVKLKLVKVFEKFLVKFGLQFKGKTRE